ncbi:MAG: CDP-diacylglycerol--glycerol-3-phosphate 3-phosphatidyltransferase [Gammaproteobacteria bacterium]|nr:CDP-diacylglycerol--glycerol-3-phosphate 3-phosphatidyltransferase [Gammaproteobacteria bacterium]
MKLTVPTALTLFRIVLIPIFVLLFYLPTPLGAKLAALVFALASITDWFDGFLARMLKQESAFGAFLDPVADKLIVAAAIVLIVQADPRALVAIPSIIIVSREIAVSALREWMAEVGERAAVKVSFVGKAKTTVQMFALVFLIWQQDLLGLPIYMIGLVLYYVAAILTLYSMFCYLQAAWPTLTQED